MKKILLLTLLLFSGIISTATEPTPSPAVTPKPYPLTTCIVSDNDLDSMGEQTSIIFEGQEIKFCCKPCVAKFKKNPAKYLKKLPPPK